MTTQAKQAPADQAGGRFGTFCRGIYPQYFDNIGDYSFSTDWLGSRPGRLMGGGSLLSPWLI